jgi:hypothetical protein
LPTVFDAPGRNEAAHKRAAAHSSVALCYYLAAGIVFDPFLGTLMVLATRTLTLREGDHEREIAIRIFAPERLDAAAWSCPYEIDWPDGARKFAVHGADAVQALELALKMIGAEFTQVIIINPAICSTRRLAAATDSLWLTACAICSKATTKSIFNLHAVHST